MTRFQVMTEQHGGKTVFVLKDVQSGALARVLPEFGGNCLELKLPAGEDGPVVAVIDDFKHLDKVTRQPSRYGIPVLFPWPSGIPGGEFMFDGKRYSLNEPGESGSAHHGFVNRAKWRTVLSDCDNSSAWLTCAVDSADCGDVAKRYPSQFTLEITYRLSADGFRMEMAAQNTGERAMPMGMGLHPYFTVPFGNSGKADECRLRADVGRQWDLDVTVPFKPVSGRPERVFLPEPSLDVTAEAGTPLAERKLNAVYEAKFPGAGQSTSATVIDRANDVTLTVLASQDFGTWVFYTPPDRSAISLEPWTLTPNGFNLAAAGVADTGMIQLEPGEKWTGRIGIFLQ